VGEVDPSPTTSLAEAARPGGRDRCRRSECSPVHDSHSGCDHHRDRAPRCRLVRIAVSAGAARCALDHVLAARVQPAESVIDASGQFHGSGRCGRNAPAFVGILDDLDGPIQTGPRSPKNRGVRGRVRAPPMAKGAARASVFLFSGGADQRLVAPNAHKKRSWPDGRDGVSDSGNARYPVLGKSPLPVAGLLRKLELSPRAIGRLQPPYSAGRHQRLADSKSAGTWSASPRHSARLTMTS
jgi:hypothetical protein